MRVAGRWVLRGLLFVFVLEMCARTEDKIRYGAPFFGNYSLDSIYQYDEMGKYGRPHASYLKWHLNQEGYRGPELRSNTYRIACIGSSETFGLYETPENEWPRQLETILNGQSNAGKYDVVNTAYPGMSIGTSLSRLPKMLNAVHPKLVVIYPSYTPYIDRDTPEPWPPQSHSVSKRTPATDHWELRLSSRLSDTIKRVLPERLQNFVRNIQLRRETRNGEVMQRLPEQNINAFETDLDHLTVALQQAGVDVILVTHANRFGDSVKPEDAPFMTSWRKFFPQLGEQGFLDMERRMSDAVRRVGAAHGVPVVDAAHQVPPGAKDFAEFVHFTDAGSHALASLVAGEVQRERSGE